ncbi:ATP-binding protein [Vulcanisaeta thermophila]|uniref:ATP-binding protein n=1 Tax=Vulcanisaeta thermophila TaxID=867917 RepID=UPI0008531776|nr:DUF87 domain-containing protein [Vulcanisaeta thermophila]
MNPTLKWTLLTTLLIIGIAYHPLALLLPLLLIIKDVRDWLIEGFLSLVNPGLAPRLVVMEDYVYDAKNGVFHVVYKAEPLYDLARLTGPQYTNLWSELLRRLGLGHGEYVTFMSVNGQKYVRASLRGSGNDADSVRTRLSAIEAVLRQYFILTPLDGPELRKLMGFPKPLSRARNAAALAVLALVAYLLMGPYSLAFTIPFTALTVKSLGNYSVVRGGMLSTLRFRLAGSVMYFTMPEEEDIKQIAESNASLVSNYAIAITSNPEFRGEVVARVAREYERFVVQERGKSLARSQQWRVVLDRITQRAEEPVKVMIALDKPLNNPYMVFRASTTQLHLWVEPSINELSFDIAVIPIFHGGKLVSTSTRAVVKLGRDRENRDLTIDLDALPSGHALVVGPTGMGKTWTVSTILYRLMKSGIKVLILDPHGEYLRIPGIEPIDATKTFINIFELDGVTDIERIDRIANTFTTVFGVDPNSLIPALRTLYLDDTYHDFHEAMRKLRLEVEDTRTGLVLDKIMSYLGDAKIVGTPELLNNKALLFTNTRPVPDIMEFMMLNIIDHTYTYTMSRNIGEHLQQLLVVDEAYYVLRNPLSQLYVRGLRKFGLGTIFITQTLSDIDDDIIRNIPLAVILGGPDPYVLSVAEKYKLTDEDIKWLSTALPPHMQALTTKALIITGPIKRLGYIELEPTIKQNQ